MSKAIGRNDLCPCGSGKKYKFCCMNNTNLDDYGKIRKIVKDNGYKHELADVLCNLLKYMREKQWIGACHATSVVMYIALSELGYSPVLKLGEVKYWKGVFDHSWIEMDGKIIDLAVSMALTGEKVTNPIIFDLDIKTMSRSKCEYDVDSGLGWGNEAQYLVGKKIVDYADAFPSSITRTKNGLWDVISIALEKEIDIIQLKQKYGNIIIK